MGMERVLQLADHTPFWRCLCGYRRTRLGWRRALVCVWLLCLRRLLFRCLCLLFAAAGAKGQ